MNYFDSFGTYLRRMRSGIGFDPVRDWLVLLTTTFILLAGIIVWNAWAFDTVATGGTIGAASVKAPPIFDPATLDTIHTVFANRATEESKYLTGVYRYADPSQ